MTGTGDASKTGGRARSARRTTCRNAKPNSHGQGGIQHLPGECLFTAHSNLVPGKVFTGMFSFGNATNGDLAAAGLLRQSATPRNCFFG